MNTTPDKRQTVPWAQQASLYEVNVRQFTPEGTFSAFEAHLPRLQQMGVGILWFMPIQPIGLLNRKGSLGSYYSIRDYTAVNPEFGTLDDFRRVVARAHELGMKVILDWVANHTAWDHRWVAQHPEWFKRNAQGELHPYTYRATPEAEPEFWWDVIGLDYNRPTLWPAMTDAMLYWLREADIDGFRCDVASLVPTPFWEQARAALDRVKPVFMLAESDAPELHRRAFDMGYDWALFDTLKDIAKGRAGAPALRAWWQRRQARYPAGAIGMNFTGNHDSNSWHGSDAEFFGSLPTFQAMAVLAATLPGMPLVLGGQEAFFDKRLKFFDKDVIAWGSYRQADFYTRLLQLRRDNPALAHDAALHIEPGSNDAVIAFTREAAGRRLRVRVNLGAAPQQHQGPGGERLALGPWEWKLVAA